MGLLLSLVSRFWPYILGLSILLVGMLFIYNRGYASADSEWRLKWSEAQKQQQQELIKAKDDVHKEEQRQQADKDKALTHYAQIISDLQGSSAKLDSERTGLRTTIAAVTDNNGQANASLSTCRTTTQALGVLLEQADERAERDTRELEEANASVTVLLEAWPK